MKHLHLISLVLSALMFSTSLPARSAGPDDRQITDPKSIISVTNLRAHPVPIDDLYFTRSVSDASWSPDGMEILFITNMAGRPNLWKMSSTGGWPIQLVQSEERQYGGTWSPDGKWIVFQQDTGGNELWDIFAVPSDGGEVVNLTHTPDIREESPLWSPDGKTIAMNYKPKEGTVYDLALLDWTTHQIRKLTYEETPNHSWYSVAWSPNGTTLYANRVEVSFTDADVYAVDVASGQDDESDSARRQSFEFLFFLVARRKDTSDHQQREGRISERRLAGCCHQETDLGHGHEMGSHFRRFLSQRRIIHL